MPRRGENIVKRKDGRWEGRYFVKILSGQSKRCSVYGHTYGEVKKKLNKMKSQQLSHKASQDLTIEKLMSCWLESKRNMIKASSYNKYKNIIDNHVVPNIGGIKVDAVNSEVLNSYISYEMSCGNLLTHKGLSISTTHDICFVIKSAMKYGENIFQYQSKCFSICMPSSSQKSISVMTKAEQQTLERFLLENIDERKLGGLICLHTGLRLGEICALKWKNVFMESHVIKVVSTLQRIQNPTGETSKTYISEAIPKSGSSTRTIPISSSLHALLGNFVSVSSECYVLSGTTNCVEPRSLEYTFRRYLKLCQLPDIKFHALRHTFATRCIEQNFDVKSLSEILGHSSTKITLDRYVHPTLAQKQIQMDRLVF